MPTATAHAILSASSSHRWLACTAAPRFEQNFPDGTSSYAEEGTLAHSICELYARKQFTVMTKRKFNSELKKLKANPLFNEEMLSTAEAYVEWLTELAMTYETMPYVALEVKVDLSDYIPDGFGTCDCVMIGGDTLHIIDYKHGKGVRVDAVENSQMLYYALGALKKYGMLFNIKNVHMSICQPRISDTPSTYQLPAEDARKWGEDRKPVALEAYNGPGTFNPGEHCRFCKGKNKCRARAEMHTAFEDFKDCVPQGKAAPELSQISEDARKLLGLPPMLTDAEIGDLLTRAETLVQWYKDLQEYARETILNGGEIPGWKVVAGKSNRAFRDPDAALQTIIDAGYDRDKLFEPKSLANLEKLLGKKAFADLLGDQVVKPMGKPTLAVESDKREPYNSAVADFAGVVDG